MTITYTVEQGTTGWNVIRRDSEDGSKRRVITKPTEYAAHLAARRLQDAQ